MPRCSYRHNDFKVSPDKGYKCDYTDQCWMTDVGNFGSDSNSEHYCLFHAPLDKEPSVNDWPIEQRGTMQADQLKLLLEQWNTENKESNTDKPLAFVLSGMQCGEIDLSNFTFTGPALFDSATFTGSASFDSATFSRDARFNSATFTGNALFDSATFTETAWFVSATFTDYAYFNSATFTETAYFNAATFTKTAWFKSATFTGPASFSSATFTGDAWFISATFTGPALFNSATFTGDASFDSATFTKDSDFTNTEFNSTTDFSKTVFTQAPLFHNAALHQSTDFRGAEFKDKSSRKAPPAYRTLKIAMGDVRSKKEEADFYAYELESNLKQPDTFLSVKLFTHLYSIISDYGRSFIKPLGWLLLITFMFWGIYLSLLFSYNYAADLSPYSIQFTIEQIVKPFSIWTQKSSEVIRSSVPDKVLVFQLLASLQSIMSIALITLFLLAVRRKFKLG